jgi:Uma2 family endonuclease
MPQSAPTERHFTYGDYCRWPDDECWELIDGRPFNMSPAPTRLHQKLVLEIARQLANQLEDGPCEVYVAPFDVRLADGDEPDEEVANLVQPDVIVICDQTTGEICQAIGLCSRLRSCGTMWRSPLSERASGRDLGAGWLRRTFSHTVG